MPAEIKVGSVWKHRYVNENVKGPHQAPNLFTVTEVSDDTVSVIQASKSTPDHPQDPTTWNSEDFLDIFEPA